MCIFSEMLPKLMFIQMQFCTFFKNNVNSHSKKSVLLIPRFGKSIILSFPNRTTFSLNSQIQNAETLPGAFLQRKVVIV